MLQDTFRQLLANGQVEFVSGGWSMHDEALVGAGSGVLFRVATAELITTQ